MSQIIPGTSYYGIDGIISEGTRGRFYKKKKPISISDGISRGFSKGVFREISG